MIIFYFLKIILIKRRDFDTDFLSDAVNDISLLKMLQKVKISLE
jgi:hypothetical protein